MNPIRIHVKIEDNGNVVTVSIPQTIPEEKHLSVEMALQELENLLGNAVRTPLDHYDLEHTHTHEHTHTQ